MQFAPFRCLSDASPKCPYSPHSHSTTGNKDPASQSSASSSRRGLHFGQRKLLLSEIEYLAALTAKRQHLEKRDESTPLPLILLVYAGAACGSHLPILFTLFPSVHWILIDPAPFCPILHTILKNGFVASQSLDLPTAVRSCMQDRTDSTASSGTSVLWPVKEIINDYATEELCRALRDKYSGSYEVHFVSDIRRGDPTSLNLEEANAMITQDNALQRSLCDALHCATAMLKFHPPYPAPTAAVQPGVQGGETNIVDTEYLAGHVLFGVWSPKSSTETRLVVEDFTATCKYELKKFEEQLHWYNTHDRYQADVAAEAAILLQYLTAVHSAVPASCDWSKPLILDADHPPPPTIVALSASISHALSFPAFLPLGRVLAGGSWQLFHEDAARLCALLYDAKRADLMEEWLVRNLSTADIARIAQSCRRTTRDGGSEEDGNANGASNSAVPSEFCTVVTPKRLWTFFGLALDTPRVTGKKRRER